MDDERYQSYVSPPSIQMLTELHEDEIGLTGSDAILEQGYDYDFIIPPDPKYECPICLLVLREPIQTECGHRFCRECILKWLSESERCPVDNVVIEQGQIYPDNWAKRKIMNMKVMCPNAKRGCDMALVLKDAEKHEEECPRGLTVCPNGCGETVIRLWLSEHVTNQCKNRMITCKFCGESFSVESQENHVAICPLVVLNCEFCGCQLLRREVYDHTKNECLEAPTNCWYYRIGCTVQVKRSEMPIHLRDGIHVHMTLLATGMEKILQLLGMQHLNSAGDLRNIQLPSEVVSGLSELATSTQSLTGYFSNNYSADQGTTATCSSASGTQPNAMNNLSEEKTHANSTSTRSTVNGDPHINSADMEILNVNDHRSSVLIERGSNSSINSCGDAPKRRYPMNTSEHEMSSHSTAEPTYSSYSRSSHYYPGSENSSHNSIHGDVQLRVTGPPLDIRQTQSLPSDNETSDLSLSGPQCLSDNFVRMRKATGGNFGENVLTYEQMHSHENYAEPSLRPWILQQSNTRSAHSHGRSINDSSSLHDNLLRSGNLKSINIERSNPDIRSQIKTLNNKIAEFEGRNCGGVYMWKIPNYGKLRTDAKLGITTAVHSPPFYSSFYGYKVCIRVNLNGVQDGRGKYLSIFVHFMQGEYDEVLNWPFKGKIVISVLDQNPRCEERQPVIEVLETSQNIAAFQRPTSHRNQKGFGYVEFVPFDKLDNSTYVLGETLQVKVQVTQFDN